MTLFWTKAFDAVAGVLFPTPCVSCGGLIAANDPPLCPSCWDRLPLIDSALCRCGAPLSEAGDPGVECGRCRRDQSVISAGASLGFYAGTLHDCVVALKYHGRHKTADRLARRLFEKGTCRDLLGGADIVVAVPLHANRLRTRGFNQAGLLALSLGRFSGIPVSPALLRRRDTPSQTELSAPKRRLNVANAFAVAEAARVSNRVVVLVDDVTTTGATIRECARTLLHSGAREIRAITVARAE